MEYNLSDLILYATCPYKYRYKVESKSGTSIYADDSFIVASALKESYLWYFQRLGLNSPIKPLELTRHFSKKCLDYKRASFSDTSNIVLDAKLLIQAHDLVLNADKILGPKDELVAVSYPVERTFKESLIKDTVDLIVLRRPKNEPPYVNVMFINIKGELPNDFNLLLRAHFGYSVVLRELAKDLKVVCTVLDVLSNKTSVISLKPNERVAYVRIINSLILGIRSKVYYPRPSNGACETCTFRSVCAWHIA